MALGELSVTWTGDDQMGTDFAVDEYGDEEPAASESGSESASESDQDALDQGDTVEEQHAEVVEEAVQVLEVGEEGSDG